MTSVRTRADDATRRRRSREAVIARQTDRLILVGPPFSGMIVLGEGVRRASSLVCIAARAPSANRTYTALARYPTPPTPVSCSTAMKAAARRGGVTAAMATFKRRTDVLYAVQQPFNKALLTGKTTQAKHHETELLRRIEERSHDRSTLSVSA